MGFVDGADVGWLVGLAEGSCVGVSVGLAVGSAVGTAVGLADGFAVVPVGLTEGLRVRRIVGLEVVGEMLGGVVLLGELVGVWMVWTVHSPPVAAHRSLI